MLGRVQCKNMTGLGWAISKQKIVLLPIEALLTIVSTYRWHLFLPPDGSVTDNSGLTFGSA